MSFLATLIEPILYKKFRESRNGKPETKVENIEILGHGTVVLKKEVMMKKVANINSRDMRLALEKSQSVKKALDKSNSNSMA